MTDSSPQPARSPFEFDFNVDFDTAFSHLLPFHDYSAASASASGIATSRTRSIDGFAHSTAGSINGIGQAPDLALDSSGPGTSSSTQPSNLSENTPLFNEQESYAFSEFLDKLSVDPDFLFEPKLGQSLLNWPQSIPDLPGPGPGPGPAYSLSYPEPVVQLSNPNHISIPPVISQSSSSHPTNSNQIPIDTDSSSNDHISPARVHVFPSTMLASDEQRNTHMLDFGSDTSFQKSGFTPRPSLLIKTHQQKTDENNQGLDQGDPHNGYSLHKDGRLEPLVPPNLTSPDPLIQHLTPASNGQTISLQNHNIPSQSMSSRAAATYPKYDSSKFDREEQDKDSAMSTPQNNNNGFRPLNNTKPTIKTEESNSPETENRSSMSPTPGSAHAFAKAKRENLSEDQKRMNHICSEKRRRNLIKNQFKEMCSLVPKLAHSRSNVGNQSKSAILLVVHEYLVVMVERNRKIRNLLKSKGISDAALRGAGLVREGN